MELRHTSYDLARAANRVRATEYPQAVEFANGSILAPPSEEEMARAFANVSFGENIAHDPSLPNKSLSPTAAEAIRRRAAEAEMSADPR